MREAPAYFRRRGKHYLITSGTTGYHPNPSEVAVADTFHGPWTVLGDPSPNDSSGTSYNSQVSSVFKYPGKKDLYIALADRWVPDLPEKEGAAFTTGEAAIAVRSAYGKLASGNASRITKPEWTAFNAAPLNINSSAARYVWLPLRFEGDHPFIDWRDEWSLDEFE